MLKKSLCALFLLIIGLGNVNANPKLDEGIQLGATRVIYNAADNKAAIDVINSSKIAYLIQSWVTNSPDSDIKENKLFVTTPPLFRLEADSTNAVKVVYVGDSLPQDRESVFWLSIKAIPSITKSDDNRLIIATKSQIKLFYRPVGLKGEASVAYRDIKFFAQNGQLVIDNPTPFSVSFRTITINGVALKESVTSLPFTKQVIKQKVVAGQEVVWDAINDWGGVESKMKMNIIKL